MRRKQFGQLDRLADPATGTHKLKWGSQQTKCSGRCCNTDRSCSTRDWTSR